MGGAGQALGAGGFVGGHLHHPGPRRPEGLRQQAAAATFHPGQQQPQSPTRNGEVIDQALGHKAGRHEVRRGSQGFQLGGGLAAHRRQLQGGGPVGQALAAAPEPLLHRLHAIAAGEHQPVEAVQLFQGVVEGAPALGRGYHQGGQIHHGGAGPLEQVARFCQLAFGAGHRDRAARQRAGIRWVAHGVNSSFTRLPACWSRAAASLVRPCCCSRRMALLKPCRQPGMSPASSRQTARF